MSDNFNTYINRIDSEAWRELCVSKGTLRRYAKGEEFVSIGRVGLSRHPDLFDLFSLKDIAS